MESDIQPNKHDEKLEELCHNIMTNIITYMSDDVYVEKVSNFYYIKNYNTSKAEKDFFYPSK